MLIPYFKPHLLTENKKTKIIFLDFLLSLNLNIVSNQEGNSVIKS